ncbi:MAG: sigma 54-interacting transcriptional regulator [Longimicrobiales bacterium]
MTMTAFNPLLLEVWREACRHIEIERSVDTFARLLDGELALDTLAIVRFDRGRGTLEVRARAGSAPAPSSVRAVRELRGPERRLIERWVAGGSESPLPFFMALLGEEEGTWYAGPLATEHGTAGALLIRARPGGTFDKRHEALVRALLEPFSAALENDRRLHELSALREAAEADKRSALSRLGREDLVDTVVGAQGGLAAVLDRVGLVARSDIPVLILGETGSGKEVVARTIHEQSGFASGPFIRVNCGAIPAELIDSELFGHERGAFTGATATRRGWFERADEGTLLLDEIGDMPLAAQVRLLRVLQEGTFERVGGEQAISVHVRVVAATHRDLPALVQAGRFREDLWYRIAGFPIVLPPLRERRQDIPALVEHFARRAAKRFGLKFQTATPHDLELLAAYEWPGNIRELGTVIDRAAILGEGERLDVAKALGVAATAVPLQRSEPELVVPSVVSTGVSPLADAMRVHIEAALRATHGRIEGPRGTATVLGINPHTLRARMRKLGVDWARFRD